MKGQDNWVSDEGWVPTCSFQTFPGSERYFEPPEFCDGEVVPGTEFCAEHTQEPPDSDDAKEIVWGSFGACYDFHTDRKKHV